MFLIEVSVVGVIYTFSFCLYFILAFYMLLGTKFESLFKQGKIWQIRIGMIVFAAIIAYLLASATTALFSNSIIK